MLSSNNNNNNNNNNNIGEEKVRQTEIVSDDDDMIEDEKRCRQRLRMAQAAAVLSAVLAVAVNVFGLKNPVYLMIEFIYW